MCTRACLSVALLAGLTQAASAQVPSLFSPSAALIPGMDAPASALDSFTLNDGFESYSDGPINGQGGYTTFAVNANAPAVSTTIPASGARHLRIKQGLGDATSYNGAFTQDFGDFANESSLVSVDVNISSTGGVTAAVAGQAPSQSLIAWQALFVNDGGIYILDDLDGLPGGSLGFVYTGANWTANAYRTFAVDFDAGGNSIEYYYNGALIHTASAGIFGGTAVEQIVLFGDNAYNVGQAVNYDNLNVVPAPGPIGLLVAAGLLVARRRR
jgi:hypothetical protein